MLLNVQNVGRFRSFVHQSDLSLFTVETQSHHVFALDFAAVISMLLRVGIVTTIDEDLIETGPADCRFCFEWNFFDGRANRCVTKEDFIRLLKFLDAKSNAETILRIEQMPAEINVFLRGPGVRGQ